MKNLPYSSESLLEWFLLAELTGTNAKQLKVTGHYSTHRRSGDSGAVKKPLDSTNLGRVREIFVVVGNRRNLESLQLA